MTLDNPIYMSFLGHNIDRQIYQSRRRRPLSSIAESINLQDIEDALEDISSQTTDSGESPRARQKVGFQVVLNVQHFKPEEIKVKVVYDYLVVSARHKDKKDANGWVSRQFVRKYELPENVDVGQLKAKLFSDGLLEIVVPQPKETERTLKIECVKKPFINKGREAEDAGPSGKQKETEWEMDSSKH